MRSRCEELELAFTYTVWGVCARGEATVQNYELVAVRLPKAGADVVEEDTRVAITISLPFAREMSTYVEVDFPQASRRSMRPKNDVCAHLRSQFVLICILAYISMSTVVEYCQTVWIIIFQTEFREFLLQPCLALFGRNLKIVGFEMKLAMEDVLKDRYLIE